MVKKSKVATDDSSMDEDLPEHSFILWLIEKINKKYGDDSKFTTKDYLSKLSDRIIFYIEMVQRMNDDPLYQKIDQEATDFMEENEDLGVTKNTAIRYSLNKYKPSLLEDIDIVLNPEDEDADDDMADDALRDDDESSEIMSNDDDPEPFTPLMARKR